MSKKRVVYVHVESGKMLDWSDLRSQVFRRDSHICQMCGTRRDLEVHHIKPRPLGASTLENLITLCSRCHDIAEEKKLATPELIRNWTPDEDVQPVAKVVKKALPRTEPLPNKSSRISLSFSQAVVVDEPMPIHVPKSDLPILFEELDYV